ncbi:MAG: response regulator transcription factor [Kiritimatiellae bacterium]|nr:response regulator transcription factor [Kiritimatiellia bacterium]MDD5521635.1 response regulator transcription factor [Kiritimatiellia bacterium]
MSAKKILVVEDDEDIMELISYNLKREGYSVMKAVNGEEAIKQAQSALPDIVLLDLMLPEIDGLEVCRRLKSDSKTRNIPVVMVTAKDEESDVVAGLELGAEDYVVKPFRPKELVARVRAVLRRKTQSTDAVPETIKIDELQIDQKRREVLVNGKPVELTFTEFQILYFLAQKPGWVFSRYQIVDAVRGSDYPVTDRSVDVQIVGLRKKLGESGDRIETVRGVGYRFKD